MQFPNPADSHLSIVLTETDRDYVVHHCDSSDEKLSYFWGHYHKKDEKGKLAAYKDFLKTCEQQLVLQQQFLQLAKAEV